MKKIFKILVLYAIGGFIYLFIELFFRGHTHWTMFFDGGLCFLAIGEVNEIIPWDMIFWKQCIVGGVIVTVIELASGIIINIWLGWHVWDYSSMPFNFLGQICFPFTAIWVLVSGIAIVLDDYLRFWIFKEEKPHYRLR